MLTEIGRQHTSYDNDVRPQLDTITKELNIETNWFINKGEIKFYIEYREAKIEIFFFSQSLTEEIFRVSRIYIEKLKHKADDRIMAMITNTQQWTGNSISDG